MKPNWSVLVAAALSGSAEIDLEEPCSPATSGNTASAWGTENIHQATDLKEIAEQCSHVPTVPQFFEGHSLPPCDTGTSHATDAPGGGGVEDTCAPRGDGFERSCKTCAHLRKPGLADGYCTQDLGQLKAYSDGHPLWRCTPNGGRTCPGWALHPTLQGWDFTGPPWASPPGYGEPRLLCR